MALDRDAKPAEAAQARVDGGELLSDIEFLLARARVRGSASANSALKPFGLRERHYAALSLARGSIAPTQRDLAEFLQLDPSQVVAVIDELQKLGLVERTPDARDRRVNIVTATPKGAALYTETRAAIAAARDELLADLSEAEQKTLADLLLRLAF